MKQMLTVLFAAFLAVQGQALAADKPAAKAGANVGANAAEGEFATRAAQIEALRARLSATPSTRANATLLDAENLLRQTRTAPAAQRPALQAELDATLVRLELEVNAAAAGR